MKDSLKIAIAGATGYTGIELIKILSRHPKVKINYLCAQKSIGKSIYYFDKSIKKKNLPKISKLDNINWNNVNLLFTALPNGEAQKIAKVLPSHVKLIDLSADFRLKNDKVYKKWYGIKHNCKNLINKSIYSISEFSRNNLNKYNIISCPGCYPTSVQIPLIPLIKNKMININNIIIDSKSGFSGGGKNVAKKFKNLHNSISAYGVGRHRHMAEIDQELSFAAKKKVKVSFTPHILPMFRGILSTIYLDLLGSNNAIKVYKFLKNYHKKNLFIKIAKFNVPLSTNDVVNTNCCFISVCLNRNTKKIIIISALDNLVKGASGQAVQNMNIAYKFKESAGLI
jgi:N-acetyl-gamma-glutamyl-phosphate reductase